MNSCDQTQEAREEASKLQGRIEQILQELADYKRAYEKVVIDYQRSKESRMSKSLSIGNLTGVGDSTRGIMSPSFSMMRSLSPAPTPAPLSRSIAGPGSSVSAAMDRRVGQSSNDLLSTVGSYTSTDSGRLSTAGMKFGTLSGGGAGAKYSSSGQYSYTERTGYQLDGGRSANSSTVVSEYVASVGSSEDTLPNLVILKGALPSQEANNSTQVTVTQLVTTSGDDSYN